MGREMNSWSTPLPRRICRWVIFTSSNIKNTSSLKYAINTEQFRVMIITKQAWRERLWELSLLRRNCTDIKSSITIKEALLIATTHLLLNFVYFIGFKTTSGKHRTLLRVFLQKCSNGELNMVCLMTHSIQEIMNWQKECPAVSLEPHMLVQFMRIRKIHWCYQTLLSP